MNNVNNVSLAGSVFAMDVDAQQAITAYLKKTELLLHGMPEPERAELMKDFEASIARHLHAMGYSREKATSVAVVEEVLRMMGDAGEELDQQAKASSSRWDFLKQPFTLSKKNRVVFGLCGAIAERLKVDAIWIRLAMVLLAFVTGGRAVLAYLIVGVVLSVVEGAVKPNAKALLRDSSIASEQPIRTGWRGVLNRIARVANRLLRILFVIIAALLFISSLAFSVVWLLAMIRQPAIDLWLIGFDRTAHSYLFSLSIALGIVFFTGIIFKEILFPSKKPLGPIGVLVSVAIATVLFSLAVTTGLYLKSTISAWNNRHTVSQNKSFYVSDRNMAQFRAPSYELAEA